MYQSTLKFSEHYRLRKLKLVKVHRWTLTASNGKVRDSSSEDFYNKQDCIDNAKKTGRDLVELTKNL